MKAADLYIMLQEGEGVMLEYKEALSSSLARELVVLANTAGGRILLGVRDDGTVKRMRNKAHVQHCPEPIFEENGFFTTLFYPNPEVRVMAGTQDAPRTAQVGTKIRPMRHGNPQYKYPSRTAQVPLKSGRS